MATAELLTISSIHAGSRKSNQRTAGIPAFAAKSIVGLLVASLLAVVGCTGKQQTSAAPGGDPQEILGEMIAAYQAAKAYADAGDLYFRATDRSGTVHEDQPLPFSVTFERPNKLRLHLIGADVVSDGQRLQASVRHIPGQVVDVPAPTSLSEDWFVKDEALRTAMTNRLPGVRSPQLLMLLKEAPKGQSVLEELLDGGQATLLADEKLRDRTCRRVQVASDHGVAIYWIDAESKLLQRLDLPRNAIKKQLDPAGKLTKFEAWIDFKGATFEPQLAASTFQFEVPAGTRRLVRFVPPMEPLSEGIGKQIAEFKFFDLDGQEANRAALEGKIVVLDFWNTASEVCRQNAPGRELLKQKYKPNQEVLFLAVATDPQVVPAAKLRTTLRSWGSSWPLVRDSEGFQAQAEPSALLIGPDGTIHGVSIGPSEYPTELDWGIRDLLAGENVAARKVKEHTAQREQFERELAAAASDTDVPPSTEVKIAAKSEPAALKLSPLWEAASVAAPGNILVVPGAEGDSRVLVFDGLSAVVELDSAGKETARHKLPEGAIANFMRTGNDKSGERYFAAAGLGQQRLYLLDDTGKLILEYPTESHPGIADVQFGDLSGDGQPELLVGYWDAAGVQGVSLSGERKWGNRQLANILQIAVSNRDDDERSRALCVSTRGAITPLDWRGQAGEELRVRNRALSHLVAADVDGDGQRELCALAVDPNNPARTTALGLDEQGAEQWSFELPEGIHSYVIERIVPASMGPTDGGWLFPAADGSVHLLTTKGELVDRFNTGAALTGIALATFDGGPVLLIASPERLSAWKLQPSDE